MDALHRAVLVLMAILIALSCGGSPSGPGGAVVAARATIDGQVVEFSTAGNATGAFRRPPNAAWPRGLMDLSLGNCGRPPSITMAIYDGNPATGRYEVVPFAIPPLGGTFPAEVATGRLEWSIEDAWNAGATQRGSSGSITVSSVSATRIAGSYNFTLVLRGNTAVPPPTKTVDGTFDLEIRDRVVC